MSLLKYLMMLAALIGAPLAPGVYTRTLEVEGVERAYRMHIPPSYDSAQPAPVVLAFHAAYTSADVIIESSELNKKSDEAGFIAVYPYGTAPLQKKALSFNGGNCCGEASLLRVNDVLFTALLLDDLETFVNVDRKRVFATGLSNGAAMAYRLASELSGRIAAIAAVSGPMGTQTCAPLRPVPILHMHGTEDPVAPYQGGRGTLWSGANFFSVKHTIDAWVKADGCSGEPVIEELPDRAHDNTTVVRTTYGSCRDGAEVILFTIRGGGHTWPGSHQRQGALGKCTGNISANDLMWEFFKKHPMPGGQERRYALFEQ